MLILLLINIIYNVVSIVNLEGGPAEEQFDVLTLLLVPFQQLVFELLLLFLLLFVVLLDVIFVKLLLLLF